MEELSLDQIKKKSEQAEHVDFEKGDFNLQCCENTDDAFVVVDICG